MSRVKISPSLMCADFLNLKGELDAFAAVGVEMLHFDIMDGHYVPNITFGPDFVRAVHEYSPLIQDIHLMIDVLDNYIPSLALDQRSIITFHPETSLHPFRTIELIRKHNAKPGIAFEPAVPFERYRTLIADVEMVLIMTVSPGFAGQKLIPAMIEKISEAQDYIRDKGLSVEIAVDGNVSWENVPKMVTAGATVLVGGSSSIYARPTNLRESVLRMRRLLEESRDPKFEGAQPTRKRNFSK